MLKKITFLLYLFTAIPLTLSAQTKELDRLLNEADKAYRRREPETDSLYATYVQLFNQEKIQKNFAYTGVLNYLARRAVSKGQIEKAIELQQEIVAVRRTAPDCTQGQCASAISDLATYYAQKGDYSLSITTAEEALSMYKKEYGEKHNYYNIALSNMGSYYAARGEEGDYQKAIECGEQALKYIKKGTPEYANLLNCLLVFYYQAKQTDKAEKMSAKARKEAQKRLEEDGASYATILNNQSIRLAKAGNYPDAIEYAKEAKNGYEKAGQSNTLAYAKVLVNLATFQSHVHNFKEAVGLIETAMPIIERFVGKNHPDYIRCMSDLSTNYKNLGDLGKADELSNESDKISEGLGENQNLKYAQSLSKQGAVFASNGNYTRAINQERKALSIFERRKDTLSIASSLGIIATYLFNNNKKEEGLQTAEQALDLFRKNQDKSVYFGQALNNISILYFHADDYIRAIDYAHQASEIYQQQKDTLSTVYAKILGNLGLYNFMSDCFELAVKYNTQAIELHESLLGTEHPDNIPLYYNQAVYYSKIGNQKQAVDYYTKAIDMQSAQIKTNFLHLTSNERERYWNSKQYVFKYAPLLAYMDPSNTQMATDAYNALLFMKGILLNSDIDFRNLLRKSNNTELLEKYNQLISLYEQKDFALKLPVTERTQDTEQLNRQIYDLERDLVKSCKEYGDFTENLNVNLTQVSDGLSSEDAAIEFAVVDLLGVGRTYVALLLRKGWTAPHIIRLFSEADIKDIDFMGLSLKHALANRMGIDAVYNNTEFGSMIWKPIMKELEGVKNIYFSPAGIFYQLGIENLFCEENVRINDRYQLYRLSSTKTLAQHIHHTPIENAVVYGGLTYDMNLAEIKSEHEQAKDLNYDVAMTEYEEFNEDDIYFSSELRAIDQLTTRGSVSYLEGTLHEAENIGEQLMMNGINTTFFLKEKGIEESFKSLSGHAIHLIHIATHGFYISENDIKQGNRMLAFMTTNDDNDIDNALNFSGLLLSGANYTLTGNRVPYELDDGVLTAKEIAKTDLSSAELVVLSACQTGLGEIKDDGVFGIQRGFKKAGAKSLLMSLWSVSDRATDLMMTTFYSKLSEGLSKHAAFLEAQKTVREYPNADFSSPFFWASFILLDGKQ
ncbi:MAG: tetratricopeptide repeat protein [Prevotella sp.]|nr:tetratricopeptide repeat protein [Prevotella sp.]